MRYNRNGIVRWGLLGGICLLCACGNVSLFNPAFVNFVAGGQFQVTPGPTAPFVFVRAVNDTNNKAIEFIVSIERSVAVVDDLGNPMFTDAGELLTSNVIETRRLRTLPNQPANDVGTVFECSTSPVLRVGLGENLVPLEPHLYIVEAANDLGTGCNTGITPLTLAIGNFNCGDTVIFQAFDSVAAGCGVGVKPLVQPGSEQPGQVAGPATFDILFEVFEQQSLDDD